MKQVININFHGRVVPIEVTAFEMLKAYTESLGRYFANEEGKEEIINDIESRIGELFQERLKAGSTCITDEDINAIISSMGRPEDFETDENIGSQRFTETNQSYSSTAEAASAANTTATDKRLFRDENNKVFGGVCSGLANYFNIDVVVVRIIFVILGVSFGFGIISYLVLWVAVPSSATAVIGSVRKKLYRDSDDKIIAGVCSGLGNYFGINAWIPRVLFLIPFLGFLTRWNHDFTEFIRLGFSPGSMIVYIILWLVIPEAFSTAEKLEMKGEKVDMNSIKNSVVEEMKGVQQRAGRLAKEAAFSAQEKGKQFATEAGSAARRGGRSLGDVIVLIFKIFAYFILGCIGFGVVVGLFALAVTSVGLFPLKDFVLRDGWQNVFAYGTLIFFIAVPIIGIITWIVRKIAKIKTNRKTMRLSFTGLWIIGWVCFISLIVSLGQDFRRSNNLHEEEIVLTNPTINKLELTSESPDQKFYRSKWFRLEPFRTYDEDTAIYNNISVHIFKSPNDSFRVTMLKLVNGATKTEADQMAAKMNFKVEQRDSLLVTDEGIAITRKEKFRNQGIVLMVYVPVGKQIRIDENIGWENGRISFGFENDDWRLGYRDQEEGWQHDVDYIMKADGLYDLNGKPAASWKHPEWNDDTDEDGNDNNNRNYDSGKGGGYRYNENKMLAPQQADSSAKQKMEKDKSEQNKKDSLNKNTATQKADKVYNERRDQMIAYTLPAYNPLLVMY